MSRKRGNDWFVETGVSTNHSMFIQWNTTILQNTTTSWSSIQFFINKCSICYMTQLPSRINIASTQSSLHIHCCQIDIEGIQSVTPVCRTSSRELSSMWTGQGEEQRMSMSSRNGSSVWMFSSLSNWKQDTGFIVTWLGCIVNTQGILLCTCQYKAGSKYTHYLTYMVQAW